MIDIACGVKPASSHLFDPHAVIDLQPGTRLQTDAFESNILGTWRAAGRDQNLVGKKRFSIAQRKADHAVGLTIHQPNSRFGQDSDSSLLK